MTSVDRVKSLCKERKISIHKLEMDLGFANGYIGQLKKGTLPDDRAAKIADYLGVSVDYLSGGTEPRFASEDARLVAQIRADGKLTEALHKYMALSDKKKEKVIDFISLLSEE